LNPNILHYIFLFKKFSIKEKKIQQEGLNQNKENLKFQNLIFCRRWEDGVLVRMNSPRCSGKGFRGDELKLGCLGAKLETLSQTRVLWQKVSAKSTHGGE